MREIDAVLDGMPLPPYLCDNHAKDPWMRVCSKGFGGGCEYQSIRDKKERRPRRVRDYQITIPEEWKAMINPKTGAPYTKAGLLSRMYKQLGLCRVCRKVPYIAGYTVCASCVQSERERRRRETGSVGRKLGCESYQVGRKLPAKGK